MIGQTHPLDQHQASQLAAPWLKSLKETNDLATPILALTLAYLDKVKATPEPSNYLPDLREMAWQLVGQPTPAVLELFVPEWETMIDEIIANPDDRQEILQEHLMSPYHGMRRQATASDVGNMLAEISCATLATYIRVLARRRARRRLNVLSGSWSPWKAAAARPFYSIEQRTHDLSMAIRGQRHSAANRVVQGETPSAERPAELRRMQTGLVRRAIEAASR